MNNLSDENKKPKKSYINNSNVINEGGSDDDNENSNGENVIYPKESNKLCEKEYRRFTKEYIKVLSLYNKRKLGQEVNIKEIVEEYDLPKEILEFKEKEKEREREREKEKDKVSNLNLNEHENSENYSYNLNKERIDFDNDIQPLPLINQEMKIVLYLSKPKIIGFDGKLGLFYITPTPMMSKESGYNIMIKNPENMKVIFKLKIIELITCLRRSEKSLEIQNFGTKVLSKSNHEMTFKDGEECSLVHQGINFLMNNKEDEIFY